MYINYKTWKANLSKVFEVKIKITLIGRKDREWLNKGILDPWNVLPPELGVDHMDVFTWWESIKPYIYDLCIFKILHFNKNLNIYAK